LAKHHKLMLEIFPIPAFTDNYIWVILNPDNNKASVVDPGTAEPVIDYFNTNNLQLTSILATHHHWDHTGGIPSLLSKWEVPVYKSQDLKEKDTITLQDQGLTLSVLEIPGHTLDHISFLGNNMLFCGDTLFAGGCGRLFEGTPQQMLSSLQKLSSLPKDTKIYCGHEYTSNNLKFAINVEPSSNDLLQRIQDTNAMRSQNLPTLPSTLELELKTNPFLRTDVPAVKKSVEDYCGKILNSQVEIFKQLRSWKDVF
jgi:hydroxyacylglutathione hydrolase